MALRSAEKRRRPKSDRLKDQWRKYEAHKVANTFLKKYREQEHHHAAFLLAFGMLEDRINSLFVLNRREVRGLNDYSNLIRQGINSIVTKLSDERVVDQRFKFRFQICNDLRNTAVHEPLFSVDAITKADVERVIRLKQECEKRLQNLKKSIGRKQKRQAIFLKASELVVGVSVLSDKQAKKILQGGEFIPQGSGIEQIISYYGGEIFEGIDGDKLDNLKLWVNRKREDLNDRYKPVLKQLKIQAETVLLATKRGRIVEMGAEVESANGKRSQVAIATELRLMHPGKKRLSIMTAETLVPSRQPLKKTGKLWGRAVEEYLLFHNGECRSLRLGWDGKIGRLSISG